MQGKLIEVVSDLLRERLGPTSNYVESLISIQRAYINTNHPNFLGAAAAMSSVINSRQEKEKKAALAEDRRKRERRRLKELGAVNGVEGEDEEGEEAGRAHPIPHRHHPSKGSRSESPAVRGGEHGLNHLGPTVNGVRAASPSRSTTAGAAVGKDSFLNYFFGKDGGHPGVAPTAAASTMAGHRHVSQHVEPSFSQSIRRGDNRVLERPLPAHDLESTYEGSVAQVEPDYNYIPNPNSLFVSLYIRALLFYAILSHSLPALPSHTPR